MILHTSATGLRITDPGPRQPVLRWVVELLPAYLVALAILPWVIANGVAWPWQPSTIDLQVYVYAVQDMLAGKDIYATTTPFWNLYFLYPPVAAVLMVPLAFGPYVMWQVIWTAVLVLASTLAAEPSASSADDPVAEARHLTNIFHKIGASSRTQAARYALDHGVTARR